MSMKIQGQTCRTNLSLKDLHAKHAKEYARFLIKQTPKTLRTKALSVWFAQNPCLIRVCFTRINGNREVGNTHAALAKPLNSKQKGRDAPMFLPVGAEGSKGFVNNTCADICGRATHA